MHAAAALHGMLPQHLQGNNYNMVRLAVEAAHAAVCNPHSVSNEEQSGQDVDLRALPGLQEELESTRLHLLELALGREPLTEDIKSSIG